MAVNDGDPIDAAYLTNLEERLNKLEGEMPKFGAPESQVVPQMYAGITAGQYIQPGIDKQFTIDYSAAKLSSAPSSLILTPVHTPITTHIDFYVISAGSDSALCGAYISKSTTNKPISIQFNYLVITN